MKAFSIGNVAPCGQCLSGFPRSARSAARLIVLQLRVSKRAKQLCTVSLACFEPLTKRSSNATVSVKLIVSGTPGRPAERPATPRTKASITLSFVTSNTSRSSDLNAATLIRQPLLAVMLWDGSVFSKDQPAPLGLAALAAAWSTTTHRTSARQTVCMFTATSSTLPMAGFSQVAAVLCRTLSLIRSAVCSTAPPAKASVFRSSYRLSTSTGSTAGCGVGVTASGRTLVCPYVLLSAAPCCFCCLSTSAFCSIHAMRCTSRSRAASVYSSVSP
mmetsp:Transcript_9429/g.29195  ORF Transcript_9429/g.29195 Transcript_9429/m.29195 type:complete len:273 (+) Transcript_9429:270-1088(+)